MVDILLSTYNGELYLRDLIDSILCQSYNQWHLWVRDDYSCDSTRAIIEEYIALYPNRISFLQDDHSNVGCLRSFEILLKQATAPYIMFADQDDVWLPDKIKHALHVMQDAELTTDKDTPIVVYSDLSVVDEQLQPIHSSFWEMAKIRPALLDSPQKLASNNFVTGCTMLFNQACKRVSIPFGHHAILHDAVMALSVLVHGGKLLYNPHVDILYRQHAGNVVGANRVGGVRYVLRKIQQLPRLVRFYERMYAQAKDIFVISRYEFYTNRLMYLLRR